ncbi:class I SAM-dependent methyltransferase [Candidatus Woesearchaeota archaeon]|nr:class I SAM-dependent methyltransferase [Candidatus Woesearchaeota archaeon]
MTQKFNYVDHYKIDAKEFDYFEERTGATEHDERRVHEYILSRINYEAKSILDVGAGGAWVAKTFENSDVRVVSLDISKDNVKKAKDLIPNDLHSPIVSDSFYLPFSSSSFDIIIASEIIEHVLEPEKFVHELFRVLKPEGKLIITTPYKEKLRYFLCVHCNNKTPLHAHIHSFDEKKMLSYSPKNCSANWLVFGNKYLIFLRTYIILKFFPFFLWKVTDRLANLILNKPVHILIEYKK